MIRGERCVFERRTERANGRDAFVRDERTTASVDGAHPPPTTEPDWTRERRETLCEVCDATILSDTIVL